MADSGKSIEPNWLDEMAQVSLATNSFDRLDYVEREQTRYLADPSLINSKRARIVGRLFAGDADETVRYSGLELLQEAGTRMNLPIVLNSRSDASFAVRMTAYEALLAILGTRSKKYIQPGFDDANDVVRRTCYECFEAFEGPKVLALLRSVETQEKSEVARSGLLPTLILKGDVRHMAEMQVIAKSDHLYANSPANRFLERVDELGREKEDLE